MDIFRLFLTLITLVYSVSSLAINLSQPGVYESSKYADNNIRLSIFTVGDMQDKLILASISAPGYKENNRYAIYKGNCETVNCQKITYKEYAGNKINFISNKGHYGDFISILLSENKTPIHLQYNKQKSKWLSKEAILTNYLSSVGRIQSGILTDKKLQDMENKAIESFSKLCGSTISFNYNKDDFLQHDLGHVVGMGSFYIDEIAKACHEEIYKTALSKIKEIKLIPGKQKKQMQLKSEKTLEIFLSEDSYNPVGESQVWLDSL